MNEIKKQNNKAESAGKSYERPRLRRIRLEAGEVLAKGCKMDSAGTNYSNPIGCLAPSACVDTGS